MKVVYSWLQDFVDTRDLSLTELARTLTMIGLEVDEVHVIGLPLPAGDLHEFKFTGLAWDPEKIVVAQIDEVMPHPNADRLVLCKLNDGQQEHIVLTGAPNLFEYKGKGPLPQPLKVAYAKEGAQIYDGHQPGLVLTTLKRAKIRGVESYSMVCSEKELGISEEHDGVIFLDPDAPAGTPLRDALGDAVFEVSILPNMIRNASVLGVARELAAATGRELRKPAAEIAVYGPSIHGQAAIQITDPSLNPRFVLGLIRDVCPTPSPAWVQRRLTLAGMRPINSLVDATNYVMLEIGEPLHAFDYDKLVARAGGAAPTIITRAARPGETLVTLDEVEHKLEPAMILVTDTAGPLSLAGVMGGLESEVTESTRNVLLEGASWNFINVRRTLTQLRISSEAGYRFARGVHPALAEWGVQLGLARMAAWSGGAAEVAAGLVDNYPQPQVDPVISLTAADVSRALGVEIPIERIAEILRRLEFQVTVDGDTLTAQTPPIRVDIGQGVIGRADLMEEIARLYGYNNIPEARLASELPPARRNLALEREERVRDILVSLGLQEVITYRLTSPEREARLLPEGQSAGDYVRLANPISQERGVMRRSLLAAVLEVVERNARLTERLALFEVGNVFWPCGAQLPDEPVRLAIALHGDRHPTAWDIPAGQPMDFFDLKGVLEALLDGLHISGAVFEPAADPVYHPGKCAQVRVGETVLGSFGELHPLLKRRYDFAAAPVLAADLDLTALIDQMPENYPIQGVPVFPPVLEDIALIVDEDLPAVQVEAAIRQAGGTMLAGVRLFDIFRGDQIGAGKKSLAYSLTSLAPDRTLTDTEATQIRNRIIKRVEQALGAKLRS
jgi:phenylalanyl-tRNA synthetase beta chain